MNQNVDLMMELDEISGESPKLLRLEQRKYVCTTFDQNSSNSCGDISLTTRTFNLLVVIWKRQEITKVIRTHHLGTLNISNKCNLRPHGGTKAKSISQYN